MMSPRQSIVYRSAVAAATSALFACGAASHTSDVFADTSDTDLVDEAIASSTGPDSQGNTTGGAIADEFESDDLAMGTKVLPARNPGSGAGVEPTCETKKCFCFCKAPTPPTGCYYWPSTETQFKYTCEHMDCNHFDGDACSFATTLFCDGAYSSTSVSSNLSCDGG